ncbi:MAG: polysaccharide deacetylase family protein [Lentisphaeria bacterium]|nr:polysaccharide deacetylase family protein [Lentisphaeria bacterium]
MIMKKFLLFCCSLFAASSFAVSNGTICLTFDDRYFASWEKSIPFFEKYDAHVTFFVYGNIDEKAVAAMKNLQNAGHSIGLHAVNHAKAVEYQKKYGFGAYTKNEIMPQLNVCRKNGIKIRAFAYPFSQRSIETDKELFKTFDLLRSSWYEIREKDAPLAGTDKCFVSKVGKKQLFYGFPGSGNFNLEEIKTAMKRAADENAVLVFYAHDITEVIPPSHHVAYSQLEKILEYAKSLGMAVRGMNEL